MLSLSTYLVCLLVVLSAPRVCTHRFHAILMMGVLVVVLIGHLVIMLGAILAAMLRAQEVGAMG